MENKRVDVKAIYQIKNRPLLTYKCLFRVFRVIVKKTKLRKNFIVFHDRKETFQHFIVALYKIWEENFARNFTAYYCYVSSREMRKIAALEIYIACILKTVSVDPRIK